jgi:hypothetical protein
LTRITLHGLDRNISILIAVHKKFVRKALRNCFIHLASDNKNHRDDAHDTTSARHPVGEHISECYRIIFSFRNILITSDMMESSASPSRRNDDPAHALQLPPHMLAKLMQKRSYFQRQVGFLLKVLQSIVAKMGKGPQTIPMRDLLTRLDYNRYYENKPLVGTMHTAAGSPSL